MKENSLLSNSIELLKQLIPVQSFSKQEDNTAQIIEQFFKKQRVKTRRKHNNIWAVNKYYNSELPTILLNSHHDTVKPNSGWTVDPFEPIEKDGKLYGLGSNDAGGALVALIAVFLYFYERADLKYNVIFAATAEEENSGRYGILSIIAEMPQIDIAIVGEPTGMELAVAEKGLMVLDCVAKGISGHAARNVGENAIINAIKDIEWFYTYKFPKQSDFLGPVNMTVTMIKSGIQHNIIPDKCHFVVDIRSTDVYTNEEILSIVKSYVKSEVTPRSTRLNASSIDINHPIVKSAIEIGLKIFGSPTTSDQVNLKVPSVKIGPGKSERSHTADEFIEIAEIKHGIQTYMKWLTHFNDQLNSTK